MIKKLLKYLPIYTLLLIFLGYFNLHIYYVQFGIDIYKYVTAGEIVLSFLPMTINLLAIIFSFGIILGFISLLILILSFIIGLATRGKELPQNTREKNNIDFFLENLGKLLNKEIRGKLKTSEKFKSFSLLILNDVTIFFYFIVSLSLFIKDDIVTGRKFHEYSDFVIIILLIWSAYLFFWFNHFHLKKIQDRFTKFNHIFIYLFVCSMGVFLINNHSHVSFINNHKNNKFVKIKMDDYEIFTDTNFVFLGETQDYVYLRRLEFNQNIIIPKGSIEQILFSSIPITIDTIDTH